MLLSTTITDDPLAPEAQQPGPPVANLSDQPEPKRPPAARNSRLTHGQNGSGPDRSQRETSDAYGGALFPVPGSPYRVAVCAKGYCWILQIRRGADRWEGVKFFATKRRLAVVLRQLVGARVFRAVQDKIEALPI